MYRIIIIRGKVKEKIEYLSSILCSVVLFFFFGEDGKLFPSPLCPCGLAMLLFSSRTQLPNSEVLIKLILLEITTGFGFLNMSRSQEGPNTLGKIRSTKKQA